MVKFITASLIVIMGIHSAWCQVEPKEPKEPKEPLGLALENFKYPFPVQYIKLHIQGQDVSMAYMDIKPVANENGKTVLFLHGKNFFGAYWEKSIRFMAALGYRVIVPDQVGFGKSSKASIVYSFQLLAEQTKNLLDSLSIQTVAVVGHSMGGMLATRFTLMYPARVSHLILENPIGLEDYKVKVPYSSIENEYQKELARTEAGIRKYHETYYVVWKQEYEQYVQVQYRWTLSAEYNRLAWVNALTSHMIYTQPVVYEFANIKRPTLLIIGQADRTSIGKDALSEEERKTVGQYPALGRKIAESITGAHLIEFENVGHIPHLENTERFNQALKDFIAQ
jgi:pimeloyl-ACP methyl ester carboxylesterase